jgi:hypothetical protein
MSSPEVNKQATEDAKARVVDLILAVLHVQPGTAPGTGLRSPETGDRDFVRRQRPHARYLNRGNARILRAILQRPGNAGSHRTAWWEFRP